MGWKVVVVFVVLPYRVKLVLMSSNKQIRNGCYKSSSPSETSKKVNFCLLPVDSSVWLSPSGSLLAHFTLGSLTLRAVPTRGYRSSASSTTWKMGCSTITVPLRLSDNVLSRLIGWNLEIENMEVYK